MPRQKGESHERVAPSEIRRRALPRALRAGDNLSEPLTSSDNNVASENDSDPGESQSVINGIEFSVPQLPSRRISPENWTTRPYRDDGALRTRNRAMEDMVERQLPPEEIGMMIQRLEKRADQREQRTYVEGVAMADVHESAITPSVGLTFLPGADSPRVARYEQTNMTSEVPDQKDAMWRVNTAGTLLKNFDVSSDMSIIQVDQTSDVIARAKGRLRKRDSLFQDHRKPVKVGGHDYDAVTIDSECVKIVNDLRIREWDMESTLIEVDSTSLWGLIINCRHLILRKGPEMTFEEKRVLLDTMIEDARRLCVRSPILFRMSTRSRIIHSKNTRYGTDQGDMFRTLTTSKGIKETISLSASYYNSLDRVGSNGKTQKFIRPRFLQMICLLLALLNDDDLAELRTFLETTYHLKAERRDIEILILKVIPLLSINSQVFLGALVPAIENFPLYELRDEDDSHCWNVFLHRILKHGYLLPGTIQDLGRDQMSWIVKWPKDGFHTSAVFNNLQYAGSLRTINDIPPVVFHPEASVEEVMVMMTNGSKYTIGSADLERITCLIPGRYTVREPGPRGRNYDLDIQEYHINADLDEAIRIINQIISKTNAWLAGPRRSGSVTRFNGFIRRSNNAPGFLNEYKGSGRLTRNLAILGDARLALGYKIEGRKIPQSDLVRRMVREIQGIREIIIYIERRMNHEADSRSFRDEKLELRRVIEEVKNKVDMAETHRQRVSRDEEISDEPIAKCLYPNSELVGSREPEVWNDYDAWQESDQPHGVMNPLNIHAKQSTVTSVFWLSESIIELSLRGHTSKYFVTPLVPVMEGERNDEVQIGDIAVLAGQYIIIAVHAEDSTPANPGYTMTNYLKITSVETENRTRRGMNRAPKTDEKTLCIFR